MLDTLLLSCLVALLLWKLLLPAPRPILGIYARRGARARLKQCVMWLLLKLRKRRAGGEEAGLGVRKTDNPALLERAQKLGPGNLAIDAVLFSGAAQDGTGVVVAAARRPAGLVQIILLVRLPGRGVLVHPVHPDSKDFLYF